MPSRSLWRAPGLPDGALCLSLAATMRPCLTDNHVLCSDLSDIVRRSCLTASRPP